MENGFFDRNFIHSGKARAEPASRYAASTLTNYFTAWCDATTRAARKDLKTWNYKRHETAYHASRAMVAAHRRAQHQLLDFYGHARRAGDAPETVAEATVVLESAWQCRAVERNIKQIAPGLAKLVDTNVVAHHVLDVQHELAAELVHRGVLTAAGAAEVCRDLDSDRGALKAARRRRKDANVDRHVDRVRGREVVTSASQQEMPRLRMTNALRANTTVSTNTRTTGGTVTDESSEI